LEKKIFNNWPSSGSWSVAIVAVPTVREHDGLAMSSRNAYLRSEERERALCIPRALRSVHDAFASGINDGTALEQMARSVIASSVDAIDYITVADPQTLCPVTATSPTPTAILLAVAVRIGTTRLIDNIVLGEDAPPSV
jgi:pantoate--beta-alanine ligase